MKENRLNKLGALFMMMILIVNMLPINAFAVIDDDGYAEPQLIKDERVIKVVYLDKKSTSSIHYQTEGFIFHLHDDNGEAYTTENSVYTQMGFDEVYTSDLGNGYIETTFTINAKSLDKILRKINYYQSGQDHFYMSPIMGVYSGSGKLLGTYYTQSDMLASQNWADPSGIRSRYDNPIYWNVQYKYEVEYKGVFGEFSETIDSYLGQSGQSLLHTFPSEYRELQYYGYQIEYLDENGNHVVTPMSSSSENMASFSYPNTDVKIVGYYKQPDVEEEPTPSGEIVADADGSTEVRAGDMVYLFGDKSYSTNGEITSYDWWSPNASFKPVSSVHSGTWFPSSATGYQIVRLTVTDETDASDDDIHRVYIMPPWVKGEFEASTAKINRTLTLTSTFDEPDMYPVNRFSWVFNKRYLTNESLNQKEVHVLPREVGKMNVSLTGSNGYSEDTILKEINVAPDLPPVADFEYEPVQYRNPYNNNKGEIIFKNHSVSNDGDYIKNIKIYYRHDTDNSYEDDVKNNRGNDAIYDGEWTLGYDGPSTDKIVVEVDKLGHYELKAQVTEGYDNTIPELLEDDDYLKTWQKDIFVEVDNKAPETTLEVDKIKKATIGIAVPSNLNIDEYQQYVDDILKPQLLEQNIEADVQLLDYTENYPISSAPFIYAYAPSDYYDGYSSYWSSATGTSVSYRVSDGRISTSATYLSLDNRSSYYYYPYDMDYETDDDGDYHVDRYYEGEFGYKTPRGSGHFKLTTLANYMVSALNTTKNEGDTDTYKIEYTGREYWYYRSEVYANIASKMSLQGILKNGSVIFYASAYNWNQSKSLNGYVTFNPNYRNFQMSTDEEIQELGTLRMTFGENYDYTKTYSVGGYPRSVQTGQWSWGTEGEHVFNFNGSEIFNSGRVYPYYSYDMSCHFNKFIDNKEISRTIKERFKWGDDENKYLLVFNNLNLKHYPSQDFVNLSGEKDIDLLMYGNPIGKSLFDTFVGEEHGVNGSVMDFKKNDVKSMIEDAAHYIEMDMFEDHGQTIYATPDDELKFKTQTVDYERDPLTQEGVLFETFDKNYFENPTGIFDKLNEIINTEDVQTHYDATGKYTLFGQSKDEATREPLFEDYNKFSVKTDESISKLFIHRKPIADFDIAVFSRTPLIKDNSYDIDHESEAEKGIIERQWKWKFDKEDLWHTSKPTAESLTGISGDQLTVGLRVKDKEYTWSDWALKTVIPERYSAGVTGTIDSPVPSGAIITLKDIMTTTGLNTPSTSYYHKSVESKFVVNGSFYSQYGRAKAYEYSNESLKKDSTSKRPYDDLFYQWDDYTLKLPDDIRDGQYKVRLTFNYGYTNRWSGGSSSGNRSVSKDIPFTVKTPIDVTGDLPDEVKLTKNFTATAETNQYADKVTLTLFSGTTYQRTPVQMNFVKEENGKKYWQVTTAVEASEAPEGDYVGKFTAYTKSGKTAVDTDAYTYIINIPPKVNFTTYDPADPLYVGQTLTYTVLPTDDNDPEVDLDYYVKKPGDTFKKVKTYQQVTQGQAFVLDGVLLDREGDYEFKVIATDPFGDTGECLSTLTVKPRGIRNMTIEGAWNHWRGQINLYGDRMSMMPHRFLSYEKVYITVTTDAIPDKVEIDFSPDLEAMTYTDKFGNVYHYEDDIYETVNFPMVLKCVSKDLEADTSTWKGEYILPLADSTLDFDDVRKYPSYWLKGETYYTDTYEEDGDVIYKAHKSIDDLEITGNIYDLIEIQPSYH